jgi:zinc/manganese transport system ATP-binding protein
MTAHAPGRPPAAVPAVEVAGAFAGYGGSIALRDLSCTIQPGELVGIVGPSGSGKTTLLRLLTGRVTRYAGSVRVFGQPVGPRQPPPRVGYVPQLGGHDRDFPLTVEQAVLLGLTAQSRGTPWFTSAERGRARTLLERLGLGGLARKPISALSGGQQQRMLIARAIIRDSGLLLLDEPTSGIDLATRRDMLRLLAELNAGGLTIVLTTHDLNWVAAQLPRVICVHGTVTADGPPAGVLTPEVLRTTFGADARVVRDGDSILIADAEPLLPPRPARAPGTTG